MNINTILTLDQYFDTVKEKLPLWNPKELAELISDSVILPLYTNEFLNYAAEIFIGKIKSATAQDVTLITDALSSIGDVFKSTIAEINNKAPKS